MYAKEAYEQSRSMYMYMYIQVIRSLQLDEQSPSSRYLTVSRACDLQQVLVHVYGNDTDNKVEFWKLEAPRRALASETPHPHDPRIAATRNPLHNSSVTQLPLSPNNAHKSLTHPEHHNRPHSVPRVEACLTSPKTLPSTPTQPPNRPNHGQRRAMDRPAQDQRRL